MAEKPKGGRTVAVERPRRIAVDGNTGGFTLVPLSDAEYAEWQQGATDELAREQRDTTARQRLVALRRRYGTAAGSPGAKLVAAQQATPTQPIAAVLTNAERDGMLLFLFVALGHIFGEVNRND